MGDARTKTAVATHTGSGYARSCYATAPGFFGACPWCGTELNGRGRLAHLEAGFNPETLDPVYAPASVVCETCDWHAREFGRLRI